MDDEARSQSVAVTANELARLHTLTETVSKHDFVTPQTSIDFAAKVERQAREASQAFVLRQISPHSQSLTNLGENDGGPSYSISFNAKGGFLNKKHHISITKNERGLSTAPPFAETKLQPYVVDTAIALKGPGLPSSIILHDIGRDRFKCQINETACLWQPLGPSINVLELVKEKGGKVALFVYSENVPPRRGSLPGRLKMMGSEEVGELHIIDGEVGRGMGRDEVLASAVVVLEKLKRRAVGYGY